MIKKAGAILLTLLLFPALALADALKKGTVLKVDQKQKQIVVKTEKGEETVLFTSSTKGIENARVGATVTVKYSEKDGQPKVSEILPGDGSPEAAPGRKAAPRK